MAQNENPQNPQPADEVETVVQAAVTDTAQQAPAVDPTVDVTAAYAVPENVSAQSPSPEKKEYSYPRKMVISGFVLGIVGTALGALALSIALAGFAHDFGGSGGHGGRSEGGYSRMDDFGDWEGYEEEWDWDGQDDRGSGRSSEDSNSGERGGRSDRDRSDTTSEDDTQSA